MKLFKKNIWLLFFFILFFGGVILSIIIYTSSIQIKNKYKIEQEHIVKISSNSLNSIFLQYEMMLDILGNQLVQDKEYQEVLKSKIILDNLLELSPSIVAFGLAKPDGQLYITSSNLKNSEDLPNLLEKAETKKSFEKTLSSKKMIIGRTYFHKTLNTLVIPIRKTIIDKKGEVIAVMTAGINVSKSLNSLLNEKSLLHLVRAEDFYFQLTNKKDNNFNFYNNPIAKDFITRLSNKIEKEYDTSLNSIKNSDNIVSIVYYNIKDKKEYLLSAQYIKRYEEWMIRETAFDNVNNEIFSIAVLFMIIYLIIIAILYYLFLYINKHEKEKNEELKFQATHDYLTSLNNRLFLAKDFIKLNQDKAFTLFFIDMDNFKNINDNYGNQVGDLILQKISTRLLSFKASNDDFFIRYSGDEFIFISRTIKKDEVIELANEIIKKLSQSFDMKDYQLLLSTSIGISQFPTDSKNIDEIKRYADIAMYESKKDKNKFTIFEDTLKEKYQREAQIEQELKSALAKNEIYMVYQPQINNDEKLYGVEALVRWENEKLGFIPPDEFIKIAENCGLITKIGDFIVDRCLNEMKEFSSKKNIDFQLSINISVKQLMEKNFYEKLIAKIKETNFDKTKLTLEVTENVFIEDINFIIKLLNKIRKQKIKISLDDFGTGYSSLSLLKKLPIDELKIDKTFVDDILQDKDALKMAKSIISIGRKFNMTILAEGIETEEQKNILSKYRCNFYQGYHYSKPLKIEDLNNYCNKLEELELC